jgi:endonuclease III
LYASDIVIVSSERKTSARGQDLNMPTGQATARKSAAQKKAKPTASNKTVDPLSPQRIREILHHLDEAYPNVRCALNHNSAWELLAATILSAQCTDVRVNKVTPDLFRKYPTVRDLAAADPEEVEPVIQTTGFFRNKAKSLVGSARALVEKFGGKVPDNMDDLLTLPGVARKTANVVLGSWFNKAVGVVVDTHVQRISRRLELTQNEDPKRIEQDLMKVLPQEKWIAFSHQVIHHGRAVCIARRPKCADCTMETLCHAADKTWSTVDVHKSAKP